MAATKRKKARPEALQSLIPNKALRLRGPGPLLSAARIKSSIVSVYALPLGMSPPIVLSAKHTFDDQTGAFLSALRTRAFNAGYPFVEYPFSGSGRQEGGILTVVLPNRQNVGYALQYRVYNDVFPINPGKYVVDVFLDQYTAPFQSYETDIQATQQTLGIFVPPRANQLTWISLDLYPSWSTAGAWTLYDVTINFVQF